MMQHALEKSRYFSAIAWVTIISFSIFTYALAKNLQQESSALSERVSLTTSTLEEIP